MLGALVFVRSHAGPSCRKIMVSGGKTDLESGLGDRKDRLARPAAAASELSRTPGLLLRRRLRSRTGRRCSVFKGGVSARSRSALSRCPLERRRL